MISTTCCLAAPACPSPSCKVPPPFSEIRNVVIPFSEIRNAVKYHSYTSPSVIPWNLSDENPNLNMKPIGQPILRPPGGKIYDQKNCCNPFVQLLWQY